MSRTTVVTLTVAAALLAVPAWAQKAQNPQNVNVTNTVLPVDSAHARLPWRLARECSATSSCRADYTVPTGYNLVIESVAMGPGHAEGCCVYDVLVTDAEVSIGGQNPARFVIPRPGGPWAGFSGRITVAEGEPVSVYFAFQMMTDLSVAASGYLVPTASNSLAQ